MQYVELTHNLGYVMDDIPESMLDLIQGKALLAREARESHAPNLVGQIKEEWHIPFDDDLIPFVDYLSDLASTYEEHVGKPPAPPGSRKVFPHIRFWLNHQRKTEYQPAHTHDGAYSFVIWVKVPYLLEDEFDLPFVRNAKEKTAGCFCFIRPEPFTNLVFQERLLIDRRYEKKIVLFPATLTHVVYPFYTSDEDRISIAGNLADATLFTDP